MILFPSVFCRGLSSLVRKFSNCGKQRLWYTIIDSEGSPLHRDLPDWTQVPEGILVDRFRDVVRNDNISILSGIRANELLLYKNKDSLKHKVVSSDRDVLQKNHKTDPIVLVVPKLDGITPEDFRRIQNEEFAAAVRTRTALSALAQADHLERQFRCVYEKPTFGDTLKSQRDFARRTRLMTKGNLDPYKIIYKVNGVDFSSEHWTFLGLLNDAARRQLHCMRLPISHDGKEHATFLSVSGWEDKQEEILSDLMRAVETKPGSEYCLIIDALRNREN